MTNETNITCPKCGAEIPLTEAVSHHIREQLAGDFDKQRQELNAAIAAREEKLNTARMELEQRQQALQAEVSRQLAAERQALLAEAGRQAEARLGTQIRDLESQVTEQRGKLKTAQDAELALRKRQREVEESAANLQLEVARKLDAERAKIADTARQQAVEAERLKLADKEKLIGDLQREIQNLKQKSEQGSTQLQGETLELDLENQLRSAFPFDEIMEVKKGQRGADATQRVRTNTGFDCGSILWEAKRARNWSSDWPEKLKASPKAPATGDCHQHLRLAAGLHVAVVIRKTHHGVGVAHI